MNPSSTEDVLELLDSHIVSAALGAALELGLFWLLREEALAAEDHSQRLGIPLNRCRYWLQLLGSTGLISELSGRCAPSRTARTAILDVYSQHTWSLLAQEPREQFRVVLDLALHIYQPGSTWAAQGLMRPDYYAQMVQDPKRARRFTRMLYELHRPLANQLALFLDMRGVDRLLDLGGGSGVVSLALLRRYPHLTAVVLDTANVCAAGREIAADNPEAGRIQYEPIDFVRDALPVGFDTVLECDVGVHSQALFSKTLSALNPDGRLVIVDQFAPATGVAPPSRLKLGLCRFTGEPGLGVSHRQRDPGHACPGRLPPALLPTIAAGRCYALVRGLAGDRGQAVVTELGINANRTEEDGSSPERCCKSLAPRAWPEGLGRVR